MISIGGNRPDLMTKSKSFDDIKKINENNSNKERRRSSGSEKKSEKNENIVQSSSTDTVYVDSSNVPLDPIDILLRERLSQEDLGPSDSTKTSNSLSENKNPLGILGSLGTLPTFKSLRGLNIFPKHSNSDSDLSGKLTTNTKKLKSPKESRNFGDFFIRRITTNEKENENENEGEQEEGEGEGEGMEDDEAGGEVLELLDEDGFSDNFDDHSVEKNSDRHLSMGGNEGEGEGEGEAGYDSDLISLNLIYSKTPTEDSVNNTGNNSEIFENNNSDISDDSTSTSKNQKKKETKSDGEDRQNKNEKKNDNEIGGCDPIPPKSENILDRVTGNSPKSSEVKKISNHFEKDDNGDIVRDVEKVTNSNENENAGIDNGRESARRNTSKKETEEGHESGNDDDDENENENENERENNSENERENQYVDIENDTSSYTADRKSDFPTKSITDNNDYSGNENDSTVGETEANSVTYNTAHTAPIQSDFITTDARTLYSTDNNAKSTRITRTYPPTSSTHTSSTYTSGTHAISTYAPQPSLVMSQSANCLTDRGSAGRGAGTGFAPQRNQSIPMRPSCEYHFVEVHLL